MDLNELLAARRDLVAKLGNLEDMRRPLQAQLERVERDLFERITLVAGALQGMAPKPAPTQVLVGVKWPQPARTWPLPDSSGEEAALAASAASAAASASASVAVKASDATGKLMPHVLDALRAIGKPASRAEIFEYLVRKGVAIPGKDPKANLSAHLSYSTECARDDEGRWYIKQPELINPPDEEEGRQTPA